MLLDSPSTAVMSVNTVALSAMSIVAGFFMAVGVMKKTVSSLEEKVKKLDENFNLVTRLEVMLSMINKSVEALHRRQDDADEITRRIEIAFSQYQGQQQAKPNWPPADPRRPYETMTPPPRTVAKKEREP